MYIVEQIDIIPEHI